MSTKWFELCCEALFQAETFVLLPSGGKSPPHTPVESNPMDYIKFGNTGLLASPICLGTMSYGGPSKQFPWALTVLS